MLFDQWIVTNHHVSVICMYRNDKRVSDWCLGNERKCKRCRCCLALDVKINQEGTFVRKFSLRVLFISLSFTPHLSFLNCLINHPSYVYVAKIKGTETLLIRIFSLFSCFNLFLLVFYYFLCHSMFCDLKNLFACKNTLHSALSIS